MVIYLSLVTTILSFLFLLPFVPLFISSFALFSSIIILSWLELIYLGLLTTTIAYTLYYFGLKSISATKSAFILLLEIIIAIFIRIFIRGEIFNIFHILGVVLIIIVIIIVNLATIDYKVKN